MQPNAQGPMTRDPRFWAVVVVLGVGAGLAGGALTLLLHLVQHLAWGYTEATFGVGVERAAWWRRLAVPASAGLLAGLGWWWLRGPVSRRLGPAVSVSEAVWNPGRRMGLLRSVLDGVLQIVIVGLGASLGREGAPREVAAALGSRFGELTGLSDEQRRVLVACGAGAGLAAVYNVPLGAGLFTCEVLLGSLTLPAAVPAVLTSILATATAWALIGDEPVYLAGTPGPSASVVVFAVVVTPVAAAGAVGWVRLVAWSARGQPRGRRLPVATTLVFAAVGGVAVAAPQLLGNGKGPTQLVLDGGGTLGMLALLVVLRPLAAAASLRSGARGGLFTPTLATGALLGAVLGRLWADLWPGSPAGAYALVGAAAFLAASCQAPLSTVVLVLELTHVGTGLLVPVAVAALVAAFLARLVEPRSTYTAAMSEPAAAPDPAAGR